MCRQEEEFIRLASAIIQAESDPCFQRADAVEYHFHPAVSDEADRQRHAALLETDGIAIRLCAFWHVAIERRPHRVSGFPLANPFAQIFPKQISEPVVAGLQEGDPTFDPLAVSVIQICAVNVFADASRHSLIHAPAFIRGGLR